MTETLNSTQWRETCAIEKAKQLKEELVRSPWDAKEKIWVPLLTDYCTLQKERKKEKKEFNSQTPTEKSSPTGRLHFYTVQS